MSFTVQRRHRCPVTSLMICVLPLVQPQHTNESIICGDFNVHYGNINSIGAMNLATLIDNAGFVQHVTSATHLSGNMLDLLITPRAFTLLSTPVRPTTLLTDHHVLECDLTVLKPTRLTRRVCYRKYSSIDKRAFAIDIYNAFAGTTVGLIENYRHRDRRGQARTDCHACRHGSSEDTVAHGRVVRCEAHPPPRRWRKTRLAVHRQMYTTLRDAYSRQLTTTKASHFCTVIHEAGHNMKTMFGVTNVLLGRSTPVQLPDSHNDLDLAETFHQFFIDNILNIRRAIDLRAEPNTFDRQPSDVGLHQHAQLCGFTLAETADTRRIVLQSSAKFCDLDPMPMSLLKGNIDLLAPILTDIINTSLATGVVPVDMKHALETPILKKRGLDVNSLASPISNLNLVSKTLEHYVANELRRYIDTNGFNDPFQSAYRPRHSTETALVRIHEDMTQAIDSRRGVLLVLLDLSAAFDTLDHSILLLRLRDIGLTQTVFTWFKSYLAGRTNAIKIREATSAPRLIHHGVPQGSVLGPMLFSMYILPIADIFERHQIRYHIYADDTRLHAECPPLNQADALRKIDECVRDIRRWLNCNHLLLNETNTGAIIFRSTTVRSPSAIDLCGSAVSLTPTVRDIGVILDSGLDISAQVSNACRAAYINLFRIAKIRTSLTITACEPLVHSLVTSRIDYGNAVLCGISDRLLHRLEMVQRSAARVGLRIRRGDRRSMTAVLQQLHWLPVKYRIEYKLLVIVFRALHDRTPAYLASLITPYVPRRALRSADRALLTVPRHNLEHYGRRSFSRAGPTLWNSLPEDLRLNGCMDTLKARLKTHYFKLAFNV